MIPDIDYRLHLSIIKIKVHSSCEIEDIVEGMCHVAGMTNIDISMCPMRFVPICTGCGTHVCPGLQAASTYACRTLEYIFEYNEKICRYRLYDRHAGGTHACLSVCMSACLFVCLSGCLSACLPVRLFVCVSGCLSVCLPACLPVCLSV